MFTNFGIGTLLRAQSARRHGARTLRDNRGIVQIEVLEAREETIGLMAAAGFKLADDFGPNLVFRKD
jgi:hypothetical protein